MSAIDPTKPTTGTATTQSVRDNFAAAKTEIETLDSGKANAADLASHEADTNNPHAVTAAQIGTQKLTPGTPYVLNPYVSSTTGNGSHGLGQTPAFVQQYLECISTEGSYAVGDRIPAEGLPNSGGSLPNFSIGYNASTIYIQTNAGTPRAFNRGGTTLFTMTASKWKLVIQPFRVTT